MITRRNKERRIARQRAVGDLFEGLRTANLASARALFPLHTADSDCSVVDGECTGCGAWHGEPCGACGGRGYHAEWCADA